MRAVQPAIEHRGAGVAVIGNGPVAAIGDFREHTAYRGPLFTDPSLGTYHAAGLVSGVWKLFDPRSIVRMLRAFRAGVGRGPIRGSIVQQGGAFVLGPGDVERFAWRDRFGGDHAPIERVLAALPVS